ncbi:MAG: hypothetical protein AB7K09_03990 [Planctomycetota bacterium]
MLSVRGPDLRVLPDATHDVPQTVAGFDSAARKVSELDLARCLQHAVHRAGNDVAVVVVVRPDTDTWYSVAHIAGLCQLPGVNIHRLYLAIEEPGDTGDAARFRLRSVVIADPPRPARDSWRLELAVSVHPQHDDSDEHRVFHSLSAERFGTWPRLYRDPVDVATEATQLDAAFRRDLVLANDPAICIDTWLAPVGLLMRVVDSIERVKANDNVRVAHTTVCIRTDTWPRSRLRRSAPGSVPFASPVAGRNVHDTFRVRAAGLTLTCDPPGASPDAGRADEAGDDKADPTEDSRIVKDAVDDTNEDPTNDPAAREPEPDTEPWNPDEKRPDF